MKRTNDNMKELKQMIAATAPMITAMYAFERKITEALIKLVNGKSNSVEHLATMDSICEEFLDSLTESLVNALPEKVVTEEELECIMGILKPYFIQILDADIEMTEAIITMAGGDPDKANEIFDYSQAKLTKNIKNMMTYIATFDMLTNITAEKNRIDHEYFSKHNVYDNIVNELKKLKESAEFDEEMAEITGETKSAKGKKASKVEKSEVINEILKKVNDLDQEAYKDFTEKMKKYEK